MTIQIGYLLSILCTQKKTTPLTGIKRQYNFLCRARKLVFRLLPYEKKPLGGKKKNVYSILI